LSSEEIPPLRIGHAEREAAQQALDEHLAAGWVCRPHGRGRALAAAFLWFSRRS
jgi:hypothetical protein